MVRFATAAFSIVCVLWCSSARSRSSANEAPGTLRQLHIVFRHGDRAPINLYTTSLNLDYVWPNGKGQLTNIGKQQQYELGTFLHNRYKNFLTGDPREIKVRSSNKDRCLASTQCNLAALYKPKGQWKWNNAFDWQPVAINTKPSKTDFLLNEDAYCPESEKIEKESKFGPVGKAYIEKYWNLFHYLTNHSGETVDDPKSVLDIYGSMFIEKLKNLPVPEWTAEPIWSQMEAAANDAFKVQYHSKKVQRLRGGPLVKEILGQMQKNASGQFPNIQKAYMYSTHDAIVGATMTVLHVFNNVTVPYCGTLLVELHEKDGEHVVRMFYRNSTEMPPHVLTMPGCNTDCPLEEFEQKVKTFLPDNWQKECGLATELCKG